MIRDEKIKALELDFQEFGILEKDIVEKFISGSGSGGQKVNKTQNCVYLKHIPTGIEVKCQKDRLRESNRFFARRELLEKYKEKVLGIKTKKMKELEKIKKQKSRRKRKTDLRLESKREKMDPLEDKEINL
jgi:protein subunit release factor B